jgi:DNA-binding transcriptional LysR family regulator
VAANGIPLEFRELRYFVVLCEELHFGRAADRLHISQSPLSQAIAQLERKLGTRLLDRSTRHVQVTPAGSVLLQHARRMLHEADDAIGATRRAAAGETGTLRVATGPVTRDAVLPALRHELDERFPTLTIEVAVMAGNDVPDSVAHGGADVGLALSPAARDDLEAKLLRRDSPIAVFRPGHPLAGRASVTIAELAEYPLILWPRDVSKGAHDTVLAMFVEHRPTATRIADDHSGASWDAMQSADGFAVVAASSGVSGDLATVPIQDADAEFTMWLIWSKATPPALLPELLEAADHVIAENRWA